MCTGHHLVIFDDTCFKCVRAKNKTVTVWSLGGPVEDRYSWCTCKDNNIIIEAMSCSVAAPTLWDCLPDNNNNNIIIIIVIINL